MAAADRMRVVESYTHAADHFDALPFWHHYGRRTVALAGPARGGRVLDLCCGTGASALPAAEAVGPDGAVVGVDVTPALLEVARANAARQGLSWVRFEEADVTTLDVPASSFDLVQSVFGLFFVPDVPTLLARAWSWLAPGGALVTTVWGDVVLAPGEAWFWEAVRAEDPTLDHISPASTLSTSPALADVHRRAGLPPPVILRETWRMPLASADAFWPVVLGTSNRGAFEALAPEARRRVRAAVIDRLQRAGITGLDMEALIALVRRPAGVPTQR